jgi:hypothetical protein
MFVFGSASDLPLGHVAMMGHRGRHAGAALWVGPDGAMGSSILIRTFVADGAWAAAGHRRPRGRLTAAVQPASSAP